MKLLAGGTAKSGKPWPLAPGKVYPPFFPLSVCGNLNMGIWVAWEAGGAVERFLSLAC